MPKIPSYVQRVQPIDGASAVISDPGIATYEVASDLLSGWVGVDESWSYASATTVTIPSGGTNRFQKGDKVRFDQSGSTKYFLVTNIASTTITLYGGTDYTVANAAITNIYFSRGVNPFGFPRQFNFTPSITNLTLGSATVNAKLRAYGPLVHIAVAVFFAADTSIGGNLLVAPPISAQSMDVGAASEYIPLGPAGLVDLTGSPALYMGEIVQLGTASFTIRAIATGGTYATWASVNATVPFTWTTGDLLTLEAKYWMV